MANQDHEKNRVAWNEMVEVHFGHPTYRVKEFLENETTLREIELTEVGDVKGKHLLHLMCQFGLDTLSWAREGAIVTGVDISDNSIKRANELAGQVGIDARYVRSDIYDLIGRLDQKFDIVFQSYGTIAWISDVDRWAEIVAQHLKPGGFFYIVDFHPCAISIEDESVSYFDPGPYRYFDNPDYADKNYIIQAELVEWLHTLSSIINAFIKAGLRIEMFNEFQKCAYPKEKDWQEIDGWFYPPDGPQRYPAMFSLKARKD